MTPNISAEAARVIKLYLKHESYDGGDQGYDWLNSRDNLKNVIAIEALEVNNSGGAIHLFEGKYALVYLEHKLNEPAQQDLLESAEKEILRECAEWSMSYSAQMRLKNRYPRGLTFHWDPVADVAYSSLDLPHLDEVTLERLRTDGAYSGAFSRTEGGTAELLLGFTEEELEHHHAARATAVSDAHRDVIRTAFSLENPYRVRFQETSRTNWVRALSSHEEAVKFIETIRTQGLSAVTGNMTPFQ